MRLRKLIEQATTPRLVLSRVRYRLGMLRPRALGQADASFRRSDGNDAAGHLTISSPIIGQIVDQSRHDPRVLAAGQAAIANLYRARRSPMKERFDIDVAALFEDVTSRIHVIFVIPNLGDSFRDIYLTTIASALGVLGARRIWIIVTEQTGAVAGQASLANPANLDMRTIFWPDTCGGESRTDPRLLANYIHALGPSVMIVHGSRLGLRTVARYGPALKHLLRLYCVFCAGGEQDDDWRQHAAHLGGVALHATVLTDQEESVGALEGYYGILGGTGVHLLRRCEAGVVDRIRAMFGADFDDLRPTIDSEIISALLTSRERGSARHLDPNEATKAAATPGAPFDITVSVIFHGEDDLVIATLASLADMIRVAREAGLTVEARAILDRPTEQTRTLVQMHGKDLLEVEEVAFGDAGLARNAAAAKAHGHYCSILDGDDLWGSRWLLSAYRAATAPDAPEGAIWHPADIYCFIDSDLDLPSIDGSPHPSVRSAHFLLQASTQPWFDARELLLESPWIANAFARTKTFIQNPFRAADWEKHWGVEDWAWNLETLGRGIPHLIVADTVLLYREKDTGSLDVHAFSKGMLPVLH